MSLWDELGGFLGSTSVLGPLLLGGAVIGSAVISSNANTRAADIANRGTQAQVQAIREGNQQAEKRLDQLRTDTQPGMSRLRTVAMRAPTALTPEQEAALVDTRRSALRSLNASGLRGSGRATTAVLKKVEGDYRNTAIAQNRAEADRAASQLATGYTGASTGAANIDASTGQAVGAGQAQMANTGANLQTAQAGVTSSALSDVASILAGAQKSRESRFGESHDDADKNQNASL